VKPVNAIIKWYLSKRLSQINFFIENPVEAQQKVFQQLITTAAKTEWGKKHDYASIKSYSDYKNRVPVQDYESLKPYIERMMKGEQNILWSSEIGWFAKSSGTTNDKSKFIPVSLESLDDCHFKAGKDVMALYINQKNETEIFSGKGLVMGGSHQINPLNEHVKYGDVSAVMLQNMPFLGQYLQAPSVEIALISDWEEKLEKIIASTLHENITHMVGVPTWTLVLINEMLKRTGKQHMLEVWNNLELYIHGGVSFTPYREQFQKLIPSENMQYMETYNASEGFFGVQNELDKDDMLLMLDYGIFYEFIAVEDIEDTNPKVLSLDEVEIGKNYAIIISTNGGLWRYTIGDTVKFTSKYPFKIKISGRTKQFINVFGEELMVDNTDKALAIACSKTGAVLKDYTVAPVFISAAEKGGHEWIIEFQQAPSNIENFSAELDTALQLLNSDYEAKRFKDIALTTPTIHVVPEQTFYNWMKQRGKLGGQHKVPRLSNSRIYVEEILTML
jgi:hypothetical protein